MAESADATDEAGPVRIPDHDLDDLAATVNALVTQTRQQDQTLARLTDDHPAPDQASQDQQSARETAASPSGTPGGAGGVSSPFILALAGRAYTKELAALTPWVEDLLLPVYGREITSTRPWCPQWTEHPEAVARLHALWLAWQQHTSAEAGLAGPSLWHRDHLDPALVQLRAPDGPFAACTTSPTRPNHRLLATPETAGNGG